MSRINTNVQSLIARRALQINNAALNQSLERLSTGLRINSGKDDPAGLIASETLRSSMRATVQAINNATRADTIIAVTEGNLQEVSSLLLELEGLIDQSANQAGLTGQEVAANQSQIDSILESINRMANSAAFGDKKLLDGSFDFTTSGVNINESTGGSLDHLDKVRINAATVPAGSFRNVNIQVITGSTYASISAVGAGTSASIVGALGSAATFEVRGVFGSELLSFASGASMADVRDAINGSTQLTGVSAVVSGAGTAASPFSVLLASTTYGANAFVSVTVLEPSTPTNAFSADPTGRSTGTNGNVTINGSSAIVDGLDVSVRSGSLSADLTLTSSFGTASTTTTSFEITGGGAVFSISPTVGLAGTATIGIADVSSANLGSRGTGFLSTLGSGKTNDLSSANFSAAQRIVRESINQVATLRGRLGGFQKNTLQTTMNSLGVALENVTAAESAIRDADFAVETSRLTRAQILVNASTTVLQIANSQPQNALALLS